MRREGDQDILHKLDDAKADDASLEAKKNATKNAKALGDKMKKAKEDYDNMVGNKTEKANAAKEK